MNKLCLHCHAVLNGRSDKKFCNQYCKSAWHNSHANPLETTLKKVNSCLRKNRSILKFYSPLGKTTIRKEVLIKQGFNFRYFTHQFKTQKGITYNLVYDYGYLMLDDDKVLIINIQPYM